MSGVVVAVVAVIVVVAATVAFLIHTRRNHPEHGAGHQAVDERNTASPPPIGRQRYPGTDRPAGPDAESQRPAPGSARNP